MTEEVVLGEKDMERIVVLKQVKNKQLTQEEAGQELGLTSRQIRRLLKRLEANGSRGVKMKHCGGNRKFHEDFKNKIISAVKANYSDFGPSLAAEKLLEREGLRVNRETLRQWMEGSGLWKGRIRKAARIHQSRERRPRFGELVQLDGSHHDWFEGRAPKCCLLVLIDDATSKILTMRFNHAETTLGYLHCLREHLTKYGRPVAYYSDKHSIFRMTRKDCLDGKITDTQLHRVLKALQIELICANSSEAKGRVERANKTLQDRLIKEMRLQKISTIEAANKYLPNFIEQYNKKFGVEAQSPQDAHRILHHTPGSLARIMSIQTTRKVSKNLEFSHNGILYQIQRPGGGYHLRHATVTVYEHMDSSVEVLHGQESLKFTRCSHIIKQAAIVDFKEVNFVVDQMVNQHAA